MYERILHRTSRFQSPRHGRVADLLNIFTYSNYTTYYIRHIESRALFALEDVSTLYFSCIIGNQWLVILVELVSMALPNMERNWVGINKMVKRV